MGAALRHCVPRIPRAHIPEAYGCCSKRSDACG
jgi:hypothetical protein